MFPPVPGSKTNVVITIQNDTYGAQKLKAVEDGAKRLDNLLRKEYGYVSLSQEFFGPGTNMFENIKKGDQLVTLLGNVLKEWQRKGLPIGSFVLYFHGHGEQVGWMIYLQ